MSLEKSKYWSSISFTPDGSRLVVSDSDVKRGIKIWDANTGEKVLEINASTLFYFRPYSMTKGADGRWIAAAYDESTIKVWDLSSGEEVTSIAFSDTFHLSVCFRPEAALQLW